MNSISKLFVISISIIILFANLGFCIDNQSYTTLVYKKCDHNRNFTALFDNNSHSQTLASLLERLLSQSSRARYVKVTAGDEKVGITGTFQCRGDLSNEQCYSCAKEVKDISSKMCKQARIGRVQLDGCYFSYETDGFGGEETSEHEFIHGTCSKKKVEDTDGRFIKAREAAFGVAVNGIMSDERGYFETDYEYVHATAQCEGSLGGCDCGECVSAAVQIAEEKCQNSVSSWIYMDKCFIGYAYDLGGVSGNSYPGEDDEKGNHIGRTVAIVVGGAAAIGLGFIFLKFVSSCCKKDDF